jgi:alkanesulfonate monooxygenase SsuD/methylene tetrahydromethanopterin reductase-like flavin-dependent oxidoreductase (luciferase family)
MRFSVNVPNFGDFADPRNVAAVAAAAEQAGWDGLFVWDHVLHRGHQGRPFGDPWMLLTAAALATSRIRLGTLLTPVPRYRPQQLARQVATLDRLSGGRVVFAAGLGGPLEDEYRAFGDTAEPRVLAERLDEGLELLERFWSGEPVRHSGRHYEARDVTLLPAAAAPSAGVDRRVLAASRAHAAGGAVGRCGAAVRKRPARPCAGPRASTGPGGLRAQAPNGRVRAPLRLRAGRCHSPGPGQSQGRDRPAP